MKPVRIYTTPSCGFCHAAKRLLEQREVPFEEIDVTGDREARAWLAKASGQGTVPQIFFGEDSVGGFSELSALDQSGELSARLED